MAVTELLSAAVHGRSRWVWSAVLTSAAFAVSAGMTGCIIREDHHDDWDDDHQHWEDETDVVTPPPTHGTEPLLVAIDADQTVESAPGEGVGLFVEYTTGGHWRVWTACDTNLSGLDCAFEACVSVVDGSPQLRNVEGDANETDDVIESFADGFTCLGASTGSDTDGMVFDADPGAMLRLEMSLDGEAQPRFVYWVGDGILHEGAPSDPVDFVPTTP